ncbi:acyl-CoA dehydrogenase family protein [Rhodococcus sp. IEGM1428]|uniref:acyl-CoA dehydrogenase family protein n=1 Tax=Rhodococcus sp. IEGM1428 TaxID=3392191 RepID=UPI003D104C3F
MHFDLTDEQRELTAVVRSLVARRTRVADVRAAVDTESGFDTELWSQLGEQIGVVALAVPEEYGGAGYSSFETHLVLEELGRTLTPTPLFSTGVLAVQALLRVADESSRRRLLPRLVEGTTLAALGWSASPEDALPGAGIVAAHDSRGWTLTGESALVLGGDTADLLLVLSRTPYGTSLFEVDPDQPRLTRTAHRGMDQTLRFADISFDGATATLLGTADEEQLRNLFSSFVVANTALQVGGAQGAFDRTVEYLEERVQFGRPLGSFQALKHRAADMLVEVETSRSISWAAAWAASTNAPNTRRQAAIAASWCSESFSHIASETVQLHGGIAITWEHDAQLYFKRAHATSQLFGAPHVHRRQLVSE